MEVATIIQNPSSCFSSLSRQKNFLLLRFPQSRGESKQAIFVSSSSEFSISEFDEVFIFIAGLGLRLYRNGRLISTRGATHAVARNEEDYVSPWDEKPFQILPSGTKAYLDEQDVVSFLDPPKELIPLDPTSYNPAAYLWLVCF